MYTNVAAYTKQYCQLNIRERTSTLCASALPSWFMGNVTASSMTLRRYSMSDPWYPDAHTLAHTQAGSQPSFVGIWVAKIRRAGGSIGCPWGWLAESCQTITAVASRGPHSPQNQFQSTWRRNIIKCQDYSGPRPPAAAKNYSWQPLGDLIKCKKGEKKRRGVEAIVKVTEGRQ